MCFGGKVETDHALIERLVDQSKAISPHSRDPWGKILT